MAALRRALTAPASATILIVSIGYFLYAASRLIAAPGLQYDEVLFVNAATGEPTNGLFVAKRILGVPVMLMGYIGALKAYLYYPVFRVFGVSPATVRWPVIVISAATLGVAFALARCSFGRVVSALLVLVIAVDPVFISLTTLDYGPVALMLILKLSALLCAFLVVRTGSSGYLWGVCLACALGLFDKLNFVWFLVALAIAGGLLFRRELTMALRRNRVGFVLPLAVLAALTGLATVRLILPQLAASQAAQSGVSLTDRLHYVVGLYAGTMSGRELYHLVTKSTLSAPSAANLVALFGLLGLGATTLLAARRAGGVGRLSLRTRMLACHLLIFLVVGAQLVITKKAWGPHHVMMLYPFQLFVAFGAASSLAGPVGAAAVAGVLAASELHVGAAYARRFRPTEEFEAQWSPVFSELTAWLNEHCPDRIVSVDWGTHNQIFALGTPCTRAVSRDLWPQFRTLGDRAAQERIYHQEFENRRVLAVLFGPRWDIMPGVRDNFAGWAGSFGLVPELEQVFTSPAGVVIFEVYSVDGARPAGRAAP
jgi:hypothetical protein